MKICIIAGARPDFMKIAPLIRAIQKAKQEGKNISYKLIYTGIQQDNNLEPSLFSAMDMKAPDVYLGVEKDKNLSKVAGETMLAFEKELNTHPSHLVIVVNDLTSTMACAIVAKKKGLKLAHILAGTRSFNMDMPKEVNRMITDGLADYLFIGGMTANRNLYVTGTEDKRIYFVGNILIDTLRYNLNRATKPVTFDILKLSSKDYILLTINRHMLIEKKNNFKTLINTLLSSSENIPIIAPLHPYVEETIKQVASHNKNLHILPAQPYLSFLYYIKNAKAIITDSGNIAEEATFLGVPCITLNDYAEHPETVSMGTNELIGEDPEKLRKAIEKVIKGEWKKGDLPERWDGRTADRIVQIILNPPCPPHA